MSISNLNQLYNKITQYEYIYLKVVVCDLIEVLAYLFLEGQ